MCTLPRVANSPVLTRVSCIFNQKDFNTDFSLSKGGFSGFITNFVGSFIYFFLQFITDNKNSFLSLFSSVFLNKGNQLIVKIRFSNT